MAVRRFILVLTVLLVGGTTLACLAGAAVAAYLAPREGQGEIGGIAVGAPQHGWLRISRRFLACSGRTPAAPGESCATTVHGEPLQVNFAFAGEQWNILDCEASFRGRQSACWATNFTVSGPRYASIPAAGLGLTDEELRALWREHLIESMSEAEWQTVLNVVAGLLALGVGLSVLHVTALPRLVRIGVAAGTSVVEYGVIQLLLTLFLLFTNHID